MENQVLYMDLESVCSLLDEIEQDRTVPKNIRTAAEEAKKNIRNEKQDVAVRINHAISLLDEVSSDPNMPVYARTQIWNIVSMLEVINGETKQV